MAQSKVCARAWYGHGRARERVELGGREGGREGATVCCQRISKVCACMCVRACACVFMSGQGCSL
jgi:hypothetical protein